MLHDALSTHLLGDSHRLTTLRILRCDQVRNLSEQLEVFLGFYVYLKLTFVCGGWADASIHISAVRNCFENSTGRHDTVTTPITRTQLDSYCLATGGASVINGTSYKLFYARINTDIKLHDKVFLN